MKKPPDPQFSGYQALVNRFPNGVLVLFDAELRYRIVGPETLPFSKRDASEMVGKTIYELFREETATELEPKLDATIAGETRSFDIEYEGRVHHIETTPAQINGDPYGVLVTQDVTEERQTAHDLKRQNERLEEFAGIVSHDLRNPLIVAQGRLELAQQECDTDHHEAIATALSRMDRIITDILSLAREGKDIGELQPVSIVATTKSAWEMATEHAEDARLRYASDESRFPRIDADDHRLRQLFENLFQNAVEHGGDDVTVTVGLLDDGFYVADDGPGIPDEAHDDVFDAGYSTAEAGTGFGLNIVEQVAEAHGWTVRVTAGSDGGACFEITDVEFRE